MPEVESERVRRYLEIMDDYHSGKLGHANLTLREILVKSGEPDLINSMNKDELMYLAEKSSGILRGFFSAMATR